MHAETRHCNFVAGHSVYTLELITSMVLLYGEPVCALKAKILFLSFFGKMANIFGERGNLSIVRYDFCTWGIPRQIDQKNLEITPYISDFD